MARRGHTDARTHSKIRSARASTRRSAHRSRRGVCARHDAERSDPAASERAVNRDARGTRKRGSACKRGVSRGTMAQRRRVCERAEARCWAACLARAEQRGVAGSRPRRHRAAPAQARALARPQQRPGPRGSLRIGQDDASPAPSMDARRGGPRCCVHRGAHERHRHARSGRSRTAAPRERADRGNRHRRRCGSDWRRSSSEAPTCV